MKAPGFAGRWLLKQLQTERGFRLQWGNPWGFESPSAHQRHGSGQTEALGLAACA